MFINSATFLGNGTLILVAAAIIPAAILLRFIYKKDRLENEPPEMIWGLVLMGVISTFVAIMCERLGSMILGIFFRNDNLLYRILFYFIVVGLSEEAAKYTVLNKKTWNHPEFNCKFDGVVYSVTVALGFAVWENIGYVFMYGLGTALLRAVTAVPGHACFGVFMGFWYGMAKRCEIRADFATCKICKKLCIIMPAVIHGCYDFIASMTDTVSSFIFVGFVIIMFIICFVVTNRLSAHDEYL